MAGDLFGRDVHERADHRSGLGAFLAVQNLGHTKSMSLISWVLVMKMLDGLRSRCTMPMRVRALHAEQRLFEDPDRGRNRQPPFVVQALVEGVSLHVLHDQHQATGNLEHRVQGDNVRAIETRLRLRLNTEALQEIPDCGIDAETAP